MMRIRSVSLLFVVAMLGGCVMASMEPEMTPVEIQSMQTRSYDAQLDVSFRSVVSVFQDLGYTIQNADINSGLITAESAANSNSTFAFFTGTTRVEQTRATAFVERIGERSSVRLNFVRTEQSSSETGQTDRQDTPILDASIYQNAFERIENAIFIRSGN